MTKYTVSSINGEWQVSDTEHVLWTGDAESARGWLQERGESVALCDVDGNGTMRPIPVEWLGDGERIEGSARALSLV